MATHLEHANTEVRLAQARALSTILSGKDSLPAILAGDLNAVPDSPPMKHLLEHWTETTTGKPAPTWPSDKPRVKIDYVLYCPGTEWRVIEAQVVNESVASDHRPLLAVLEWAPGGNRTRQANGSDAEKIEIFSGEPRLIVVNGYSTSFHWPKLLARKLDRYFDGRRVVEVKLATRGGTPIAKWIDVKSGKLLPPWEQTVRPALKSKGGRPGIVLAQQSLQWVFGPRQEGIAGASDTARIKQGADAMQKYVELLVRDGADLVFLAMHIYKRPMEPEIGNERLALVELGARGIPKFQPGPDVWEPTREHYPKAFAGDGVHPSAVGAEIMAQLWFETLLAHDGLNVPAWSREEMQQAIKSTAVPSRDGSRSGVRRRPGRGQIPTPRSHRGREG